MLDRNRLQDMFDLLGCEEPLGISYTENAPESSVTPASGTGHACIINYLRI